MFSHTKVNQGLGRAASAAESYVITDPYFSRNTLLLETNQSTTNTFSDSSTNGFVLTPVGDVIGTSFSPYKTNWSAYFDGTGDYITLPNNTNYAPGTGDFTIEFWISIQGVPGANGYNLLDMRPASTNGIYINLYLASNRTVRFWSNGADRINHGVVLNYNDWYHVALIRNSGVTRLFVDGVQGGVNYTDTGNYLSTSGFILGGGYLQSATPGSTITNLFIGNISNVRYIKGQALNASTTRFTAPQQPVNTSSVSWTGASVANSITGSVNLLALHTNRFVDGSSIAATISVFGEVRIENYAPFVESTSTVGSAYFDGTGDYLQATIGNISSFFTDLGDFTFEAWVYPLSFSGPQYSCAIFGIGSNDDLMLRANPSASVTTTLNVYGIDSVNGAAFGGSGTSTSATIRLFEWCHVVFTRESGTLNLWINGTRVLNNSTYTSTQLRQTATFIRIGGANAGTNPNWNGHIANAKFVGGSAIYTGSTITVPTQPVTATSGTQLLTCENNVSPVNLPVDVSNTQGLIKTGNTTLSSFSPYNSVDSELSLYFGGAGNYLVSNAAVLTSSTSTFTIEAWIYPTATPTTAIPGLIGDMTPASTSSWLTFGPNNSNLLQLYWYDSVAKNATGNTFIPLNKWTHIAASVNANAIQLYVNGIQQTLTGTTTLTNRGGTTNTVAMGQWNSSNVFTGYATNVSILSGTAKYTSTFTPSLLPIGENTTNQTLLLGGYRQGTTGARRIIYRHDITDLNIATTPKNITPTGTNIFTTPFTPLNSVNRARDTNLQGGSIYFDGTGDTLRTQATRNLFAPADFSISFWFYLNTLATQQHLIGNYTAAATTDWVIEVTTAGTLQVFLDGSTLRLSHTGIQAKKWYHVTIFRQTLAAGANSIFGYINGTGFNTTGSYGTAAAFGTTTKAVYLGARGGSTNPMNGYIANLQIIEGANQAYSDSPPARPTTNLLPFYSTSKIARTVLLLNGLQLGAYDVTEQNTLELVGNPLITTKQKRVGQTALYFNGTSTYIRARSHNPNLHSYGLGDFTVEMWLYPETFANYISVYCQSNSAANATGFHIGLNVSGQIFIYSASAFQVTSNNSLTLNAWNHVAVVRFENVVTIYINGTASTNTWNLTTQTFTDGACVIGVSPALTTEFYRGYLHEFRASKIARYLQNFTPATTKLPQIAVSSVVEYVAVGGGASGAHTNSFRGVGGGGAGGVVTGYLDLEANQQLTVTVGAGGASTVYASDTQDGNNGVTSSITVGTQQPIRAFGGGYGMSAGFANKTAPDGYSYSTGQYGPGSWGGSTGGNGYQIGSGAAAAYQGHRGGDHQTYGDSGGGGGAGGAGAPAMSGTGAYRIYQNGDTKLPNGRGGNSITLFGVELAGGGGGGSGSYFTGNPDSGNGGFGGGGNGTNIGGKGGGDMNAPYGSAYGYTGFGDGATNTGSGGGAGGRSGATAIGPKGSGAGGSGLIMFKVPQSSYFSEIDSGLTYTIDASTYSGYKIYKFTGGTGTLKFNTLATVATNYVAVGGGGGGGRERGGGGGAGAYTFGTLNLRLEYPYSVTIGAGGSGSSTRTFSGSSGNDTTFSALQYPVIGGGGGGSNNTTVVIAKQGSSGGGGAGATAPNAVGTGALVTSTNIFIGTPGGNGGTGSGGGGGGTFSAGTAASGTTAGTGGAGITSTITGSSVVYAAGGGGGSNAGTAGAGGSSGIGGAGSNSDSVSGAAGTINTGSGGGGGGTSPAGSGATGGSGASGVLILSYSNAYNITSSGLTISSTVSGGTRISTITAGTGTFKLVFA